MHQKTTPVRWTRRLALLPLALASLLIPAAAVAGSPPSAATQNAGVYLGKWNYDQPDPIVDPSASRQQNDVILNITLSVPFDERTTMTVSGGRFVRTSNIPNYEFTNNSFLMGVSWRF